MHIDNSDNREYHNIQIKHLKVKIEIYTRLWLGHTRLKTNRFANAFKM